MNPEQQGIILNHYKITELYSILADDESYKKYIDDLFAVSDGYMKRAIALSVLHTEAFLQSMGKAYDNLPDIDKKIFCENMLQKKEFFQDAYKMMMNSFQNAKEIKKGKVVENGEVSKKVEK